MATLNLLNSSGLTPLDLLQERLDEHQAPAGNRRPPRQPRRAIGDLPRAACAGPGLLRGEEARLGERPHVVEHRAGIHVEERGELLVRPAFEATQAKHAQAQRRTQRARAREGFGIRIIRSIVRHGASLVASD